MHGGGRGGHVNGAARGTRQQEDVEDREEIWGNRTGKERTVVRLPGEVPRYGAGEEHGPAVGGGSRGAGTPAIEGTIALACMQLR